MTDAPHRIWTFEYSDGAIPRSGDWVDEQSECPDGSPAYILATPAALAASPEVAALIREAEARGMERAAARARAYASNYERSIDGRNTIILLAEWADTEAAALQGKEVMTATQMSDPIEPGGFNGDIFYGDPIKTTMGTHRWENGQWVRLPSEMEAVLSLLADARAEAAAIRAAKGELE